MLLKLLSNFVRSAADSVYNLRSPITNIPFHFVFYQESLFRAILIAFFYVQTNLQFVILTALFLVVYLGRLLRVDLITLEGEMSVC